MTKEKIKVFSKEEWERLEEEKYLKIEQDFHDHLAEKKNWDEPIQQYYSYERDSSTDYGLEVEKYFVQMVGEVKGKRVLDIGSGY